MIETPLSPPKGKLENPTPSASCVNASASDVHHRQTQRVNKKCTSIFDSVKMFPLKRGGVLKAAPQSINQTERERENVCTGGEHEGE